jgi:hypothetical protein
MIAVSAVIIVALAALYLDLRANVKALQDEVRQSNQPVFGELARQERNNAQLEALPNYVRHVAGRTLAASKAWASCADLAFGYFQLDNGPRAVDVHRLELEKCERDTNELWRAEIEAISLP